MEQLWLCQRSRRKWRLIESSVDLLESDYCGRGKMLQHLQDSSSGFLYYITFPPNSLAISCLYSSSVCAFCCILIFFATFYLLYTKFVSSLSRCLTTSLRPLSFQYLLLYFSCTTLCFPLSRFLFKFFLSESLTE